VRAAVKKPVAEQVRATGLSLPISIVLGLASALLLDCCFPIAGPMPAWRGTIAWFALVPLLAALLRESAVAHSRYLRNAAITGYLCGLFWYILNCYWIYQTVLQFGNLSPAGSAGVLFLFSAVLGLYFALFGFVLAWLRRKVGLLAAVGLAPFLWVAIDLAAARITSMPWDQLGYSQVDSFLITHLAPLVGVYGITWVLVLANVVFVAAWLRRLRVPLWTRVGAPAVMLVLLLTNWLWAPPPPAPGAATAVLLQDNLAVNQNNLWLGEALDPEAHRMEPLWDSNIARYSDASRQSCTPFYVGVPQAGAMYVANPQCPANNIALIAWPEAPSPFRSWDSRFFFAIAGLAQSTHAEVIAGNIAREPVTIHGRMEIGEFNAASVWAADGHLEGVYDKIHLVPFGEYVPFRDVFFFATHLTQQVGDFRHGTARLVLSMNDGHRLGVFICYESIFADEVRRFAKNGAEVLVNISDDEWFGDTSAPWQHLNMARMRAIENRRWLLRDTNSGVTAAIDPYGRVTQAAAQHVFTSLAVRYGYVSRRTPYTMFGDVFAYLCVLLVLAALAKGYEPRWREYQVRKKAAAQPPLA
jgi:apolipoprotein N-acyltransferase